MPLGFVNWQYAGVLNEERWELRRKHFVMVMGGIAGGDVVLRVDDVDIRRWVMLW